MNQNRIITEPSALIRKIARDALKGRWKEIFIGFLIYLLLTNFVFDTIFPMYRTIEFGGQYFQINQSPIGGIYTLVFAGAFSYGLCLFILTFFRTKKIDNRLLFEGFGLLGKCILLNLVMGIFIALWSLLLIVPGIIAAIRYSQAFFILADHPEYSIMQCLNESKARMMGNKAKYFCLELSFIGWYFLAGLCEGGLAITGGGFIGAVISALLGLIPYAFVYAYVVTANTVFYELLVENLAVVDRSAQSEPIHMVNADYQVHEEDPEDARPYVAPDEADRYNYAPKHEEDFGAPTRDDFGAPGKEEDDF